MHNGREQIMGVKKIRKGKEFNLFEGFNFDNGLGIESQEAVLDCFHQFRWGFRLRGLEE